MDHTASYNMTRSPIQLDEGFSEETHSQPGSDSLEDSHSLFPIGSAAHLEHTKELASTLLPNQASGM
jgi:F-box and WD-40 domain protein 1/11